MPVWLPTALTAAILALTGHAIAFAIYVVKQDRAREREISDLKISMANMRAEYVAKTAWDEYNRNFEAWKEKVIDKLGHLGEVMAGIKSQGG